MYGLHRIGPSTGKRAISNLWRYSERRRIACSEWWVLDARREVYIDWKLTDGSLPLAKAVWELAVSLVRPWW